MAKGYDVSHYQAGPIPGDAEFVFVKATQGTWQVDLLHARHAADARSRGLVLGHYHYSDAGDPTAEADYFVAHADVRAGEAVVLDAEGALTRQPGCVQWALAWLDHVTARTGAVGLLYASNSDLAARDWTPVTRKYHVWAARYGAPPTVPHLIWQYTDAPLDTNTTSLTADGLRSLFTTQGDDMTPTESAMLAFIFNATQVPGQPYGWGAANSNKIDAITAQVADTHLRVRGPDTQPYDNIQDIQSRLADILAKPVGASATPGNVDVDALASAVAAKLNASLPADVVTAVVAKLKEIPA